MKNPIMEVVAFELKNNNIECQIDEKRNLICASFELPNASSVDFYLAFKNSGILEITCYDLVEFPEEKKNILYQTCSDLNNTFRYGKFFIYEEENSIVLNAFTLVDLSLASEQVMRFLSTLYSTAKDAYMILMKTIWG